MGTGRAAGQGGAAAGGRVRLARGAAKRGQQGSKCSPDSCDRGGGTTAAARTRHTSSPKTGARSVRGGLAARRQPPPGALPHWTTHSHNLCGPVDRYGERMGNCAACQAAGTDLQLEVEPGSPPGGVITPRLLCSCPAAKADRQAYRQQGDGGTEVLGHDEDAACFRPVCSAILPCASGPADAPRPNSVLGEGGGSDSSRSEAQAWDG